MIQGWEEQGQTPMFCMSGLTHTRCSQHVCQEDVPAGLRSIHFDQCFPRGQEALGVLAAQAGPCAWQLDQQGPAAG